jgi:hypothetical protein
VFIINLIKGKGKRAYEKGRREQERKERRMRKKKEMRKTRTQKIIMEKKKST